MPGDDGVADRADADAWAVPTSGLLQRRCGCTCTNRSTNTTASNLEHTDLGTARYGVGHSSRGVAWRENSDEKGDEQADARGGSYCRAGER